MAWTILDGDSPGARSRPRQNTCDKSRAANERRRARTEQAAAARGRLRARRRGTRRGKEAADEGEGRGPRAEKVGRAQEVRSTGLKQSEASAAQRARGAAGQVDGRRVESGSARPAAKYLAVRSDAKAEGETRKEGRAESTSHGRARRAADARPRRCLAAGAMKRRGQTGARTAGARRGQAACMKAFAR